MKNLFPGYYRPTLDQFKKNFEEGVFCFDTNVLLNLYRFTAKSRDELLSILQHVKIKDRVWIPHQVALEYHQNRISVILDQVGSYERIWKFLENAVAEAEKSRPLRHFHFAELTDSVRQALKKVKADLDAKRDAHPNLLEFDPILDCLTTLFCDRVGKPFDADSHKKAIIKAKERFESNRPPGFLDSTGNKKKEGDRKYGDALLWLQLLDYAKEVKRPVILVTDETGKDWWNEHTGKNHGPRPELIQEMNDEAGCSFYMYSTEQFLKHSTEFLKLDVKDEVIREANIIKKENEESAREESETKLTSPLTLIEGSSVTPGEESASAMQLSLAQYVRRMREYSVPYNRVVENTLFNERLRDMAQQIVREQRTMHDYAMALAEEQERFRKMSETKQYVAPKLREESDAE